MSKKRNKGVTKQPENNKMRVSPYLSIINLNVNGLNPSIKYLGLMDKKKQDPNYMLPTGDHFRYKDIQKKSKGMKKMV